MFAVIKTGGKQYLVQPGDKLKVEKLPARNASPASNASRSDAGWHSDAGGEKEDGKEISFSDVLLLEKNKKLEIGVPTVKGVEVKAKVLGQVKGEKLIIFKYKPKKRYKRKIGHRQKFTEVEILSIESK